LEPPLQTLRNPEFTLIVGERLDQTVTDQRIRIRVLERLRGDQDVPDQIQLLILDRDDRYILTGVPYLMAYSDVLRLPGKPRAMARDPDRRQLLHIDGADPAVFTNTGHNRALLAESHREVEMNDDYRETIMAGLGSGSPPVVDLWSAELAIRPAMFMNLLPEDIHLVQDVVDDPLMRPASRARLLMAALDGAPDAGDLWYVKSAQAILDQTSIHMDRELPEADHLIYAALLVAQSKPELKAKRAVQKWLQSTPPLAENAALALRAIAPELELESVSQAIKMQDTPEPTRQMLIDYLRRLERMRAVGTNNKA